MQEGGTAPGVAVAAAAAVVATELAVGGEQPVVEVLALDGLPLVVVLVGGALQGAIPGLLVEAVQALGGSHGGAAGRPRREQGQGVTGEEAATRAEVRRGMGSNSLPGRASSPPEGRRPLVVRLKPRRYDVIGNLPKCRGWRFHRARL